MDLKGKYDSIQTAEMNPYAEMGRALIENLNLYGLGVQPKSDIEAFDKMIGIGWMVAPKAVLFIS